MNPDNQQRFVVNKTYDEIRVGDYASLSRTLMPEDVKLFAVLTGDLNPTAVDAQYSESGMFREVMAHGMWSGSLISTLLGTQFPGPGTILIDEYLHFSRPVTNGDTITGGGTSGRGFPGGPSGGGSVGCPGVAGGISGGSIGITSRPCGCRRSRDACR